MSLPNTYIELEYIESSGTQYIDTGVNLTNSTLIKTKFSMLEANGMMFGQDYIFVCNGNNLYTYNNQHSGTLQANKVYDSEIKLYPNEQYFKDGTTTIASSTFASGGYSPQHQVHSILFGRNTASSGISAVNLCKAQIYNFKIYQSDVLVRDFIPVLNKSDLSMGLWDRVNEEFCGNSGSGVFTGKFKENPQPSSKPFDIVFFYPNGTIQYDVDKSWDYNEKKLFDTWEMLSNVQIVKQDEDTNVVAIYNQDGTTLRGAYTILNDGTIEQITDGVAIPNRVGSNKTKYVFDSNNNVLDLAKANLPNLQYNHKITFNINFDGEYKFDDFNLAQPIKFYSTKDNTLFSSILTAWKYDISQNSDVIQNATFTLGKVRTDLTSKLNKVR